MSGNSPVSGSVGVMCYVYLENNLTSNPILVMAYNFQSKYNYTYLSVVICDGIQVVSALIRSYLATACFGHCALRCKYLVRKFSELSSD